MNEEQFLKVVRINDRIKEPYEVKKEIGSNLNHVLSYFEKRTNGDLRPCAEWKIRYISEILDKHDLMIRQEIENEIEELRKKIEQI